MKTAIIFVSGLFASAMAAPSPQLNGLVPGGLTGSLTGSVAGGVSPVTDQQAAAAALARLQEIQRLAQQPAQQAQTVIKTPASDPLAIVSQLIAGGGPLQQLQGLLGGANGFASTLQSLLAGVTNGGGFGAGQLTGGIANLGGLGGLSGLTDALKIQQQLLSLITGLISQLTSNQAVGSLLNQLPLPGGLGARDADLGGLGGLLDLLNILDVIFGGLLP